MARTRSFPVYITFGLPRYTTEELIEVAKTLISQGQTRLKMVVAAGTDRTDEILGEPSDEDIVRDAQRVGALREAVGPKIELMMDANKGANVRAGAEAREALRACTTSRGSKTRCCRAMCA